MSASSRFFVLACSSAFVLACAKGSTPTIEAGMGTVAASTSASAPATSSVPSSVASVETDAGDMLVTALPVRSKSIGHTSYVLKLAFAGGGAAAFKPRSKLPLGDHRYRGEIAAYRLAVALGIDNVTRAVPRSFAMTTLRPLQGDLDAKALPDADATLRGAIMPWIERYEVLPLEEPGWRARWEPWLLDPKAVVPDDQRTLASAIGTMLAFDYVTGNWDRWSGANVARDGATGRVLYVDNDGAFYDPPPADSLAKQIALLGRVVRLSRRFVASLRALDPSTLPAIFGDESPGHPLLPATVVAEVATRRAKVLAVIDARPAGRIDDFE